MQGGEETGSVEGGDGCKVLGFWPKYFTDTENSRSLHESLRSVSVPTLGEKKVIWKDIQMEHQRNQKDRETVWEPDGYGKLDRRGKLLTTHRYY